MQKLVNMDAKDSQVLQHTVVKLTVYTCQRAEELISNICKKKKIGRFGSAAVGARSGRQQLQPKRKALAQGRIGSRSSPINSGQELVNPGPSATDVNCCALKTAVHCKLTKNILL